MDPLRYHHLNIVILQGDIGSDIDSRACQTLTRVVSLLDHLVSSLLLSVAYFLLFLCFLVSLFGAVLRERVRVISIARL